MTTIATDPIREATIKSLDHARTQPRPALTIDPEVAAMEIINTLPMKMEADRRYDALGDVIKDLVKNHGKPVWHDLSPIDQGNMKVAGFEGNRLMVEQGPLNIGARYAPKIDESRIFTEYGREAGRWNLTGITDAFRHLMSTGQLSTIPDDVLSVKDVASLGLYPPTLGGSKKAPGLVIDFGPSDIQGPADLSRIGKYIEVRQAYLAEQKAIDMTLDPKKEAVRAVLLTSGEVNANGSIVMPSGSPSIFNGFRLTPKMSFNVEPNRLVPFMNQDLATAAGTTRETDTRKAWEGLKYEVDEEWLKSRNEKLRYIMGPKEAGLVLLPVPKAKGKP